MRLTITDVVKVGSLACLLLGSEVYTWMPFDDQPRADTSGLLSAKAISFNRPVALPDVDQGGDTLRAHASRRGLFFGSMEDSMPGNGWETAWVQTTLGNEFNLMEPGNQLKWWMIHPSRNRYNFGPADALVDYAIAHRMKVRGHNLLWGMANPDWLGNMPAATYTKFSGPQLEDILVNHIRTVMSHYREKYPGVVTWWDVTNEVMGWNNKFNSDGIEWTNIGSNPDRADYLRVAFRAARAADPDAILCMNDWGNEGSVPDRTRNMLEAVKAFRNEGIPIDCAGMEAHLNLEAAPTYEQILKSMKAYAEIGVEVQITEFDIQTPRAVMDWNKASVIASDILAACVDSPNCTAFNNWGFSQAIYLNKGSDPSKVFMLPWDEKNQKTTEYEAMRDVLITGNRKAN
jgi:endo-1,4-beta-xylanase